MKEKNLAAQWAARAAATKVLSARWAIWNALNGDTKRLAERLRKCCASRLEMEFAADLIEGRVKSRRLREGEPSLRVDDEIAQSYFQVRALHPNWRKKQVVGKVVAMFGLKGEHGRLVYTALKSLIPERRELYEAQAGVLAAHIARKPDLEKALAERRLMVLSEGDRTRVVEFFARTPRVLREGFFARK